MINLDIEIIESKRAKKLNMPGKPAVLPICQVMAKELKRRMSLGRYVTQGTRWRGYSSNKPKKGFLTNPYYTARKSSKQWLGKGARPQMWESNRHFHSGTRPGSFSVSGAMWAGLKIHTNGTNTATLKFMGRSEGYTLRWKVKKGAKIRRKVQGKWVDTGKRKNDRKVVRKAKVSNALKAFSIFDSVNVNVLEYSPDEMGSLREFWDIWIQKTLDALYSGQIEWTGNIQTEPKSKIGKRLMMEFKSGSSPFRTE